ncbi:MAG: zinc ribbon domain-containing protein [Sorangiineae bacterium]|nr:zinc ribbon domain-containing protein [Polyangiaceae bacterium]MEB2323461.1 zinc ribbon domain-containing protein [Sorangiineae bacterium]
MTASLAPCSRCACPIEAGDLRCAICSLPTPFDASVALQASAVIMRCRGCGAAIEYDVRVQAPRCAFCGSVVALEQSLDPIEQAESFVPFRVDPATAQGALRAWLGTRGFFRPSDLVSHSTVQSLVPTWWVAWMIDAEALVSWAADSNAGSHRSAWAPHSGQAPLSLRSLVVSASRGLTFAETSALTPGYASGDLLAAPHAMPGAVIERFDVQRSAARQIVARAVEAQSAADAVAWIPGSRYRKLEVAVLLRQLSTRRLAFPSYVLAYRYRDRLHRVVVHGQDPSIILGSSPKSALKIALFVAGLVALLAVLALVAALFARAG